MTHPDRTEAIRRLARRKMRARGKAVGRWIMRFVLPLKERRRRAALIGAMTEIARQASKSRHYDFESSAAIFNVALFFLIAERDIQSVKISALTDPDPWKRSLFARIILLTIHELDMDKVTGNRLRRALDTVDVPKEIKDRAIEALRSLRLVQRRAQKEFSFLRNATIAHRDSDALAQYRAITQIDEAEVMEIAAGFYEAADAFISLVPQLITRIGTMPGLLQQFIKGQGMNAYRR